MGIGKYIWDVCVLFALFIRLYPIVPGGSHKSTAPNITYAKKKDILKALFFLLCQSVGSKRWNFRQKKTFFWSEFFVIAENNHFLFLFKWHEFSNFLFSYQTAKNLLQVSAQIFWKSCKSFSIQTITLHIGMSKF